MIGVNVNGYGPLELKKVVEKEKLTWRSFADVGALGEGAIAAKWNLSATPTFYVIDHQGVIRRKWVGSPPGARTIDAALEALVTEAEQARAR